MIYARPRVKLIVEGVNDAAAIRGLLVHSEVNPAGEAGRLVNVHKIGNQKHEGGISRLLQGIGTEIRSAKDLGVGFIVDGDLDVIARWNQVRDRMRAEGVEAPDDPPGAGFVGFSTRNKSHVGVWIMPDNQRSGAIEAFLLSMAEHQPEVVAHARAATDEATRLGATFKEKDADKARLHAYLAWQDEPGNLYGIAIARGALLGGTPETDAFIAWVRRLIAKTVELS